MHAIDRARGRLPRLRIGAALAVAVAAGTTAWVLTAPAHDDAGTGRSAIAGAARIVSLAQLRATVAATGRTAFWAGTGSARHRYELTVGGDGRVFVRYLTPEAQAGDPRAEFLTVATYPQANALEAVEAAGRRPGAVTLRLPDGGLAVYDRARATNVFVAYAGLDHQIEVFHPSEREALRVVRRGVLEPISETAWTGTRLVSAAALRAYARREAEPLFWAGPRAQRRYELTQTPDGKAYVRYLPHGTRPGDPRPDFVAIGTYPHANAYSQLRTALRRPGTVALELPDGGVALYARARPTSVYVAYPQGDVQVEVYSPAPGEARRLVESGRVRPVG